MIDRYGKTLYVSTHVSLAGDDSKVHQLGIKRLAFQPTSPLRETTAIYCM